uniref:Uncharacterized protein n=1 Tax=Candidatus Kentrum sp. LFY TaxID=2126342 RepID=A0A450V1P7_9GAMM|nr:MAG: hypothetical protein BECKLFY1418B_GA0070995_1001102 [Candidatus Kentron sp. LFY]VFJ98701.1 MAG: hypothetical protein BECKLFY1418A_GA0070994_10878 [Candidatus Kentron sp. LFY]
MIPLLRADGIEKSFPGDGTKKGVNGKSSPVLADIGLSLHRNEILGVGWPIRLRKIHPVANNRVT